MRRWVQAGPSILSIITLSFTVIWTLIIFNSGNSGVPSAPTTPPVKPIKVPQTQASALDVRPVFHDLVTDADLIAENVGAPVQRGFEILLPLYSSSGPPCIDVTVPDTDPGPAAGWTFVESPVSTVTVRGATQSAYPAVLPGTYALDIHCNSEIAAETTITLGSLTVPDRGVIIGEYPSNAMVVFDAHTSGDVTTVTYGAFGSNREGTLNPPADEACIDGGGDPDVATYWQPVQDLVSRRVNGKQEWFGTGTLVFRDTQGQSPQGRFYYGCAQDTSERPLGIAVP